MALQEVLAQALKLEVDGRDLYHKLAEMVEDPAGAWTFKKLAADEVDHYNYIKRQYDALQAGEGWSAIPEMELVDSLDAVSLVFPPEKDVLETLPENPTEEDALLFALSIEDTSFKLYHNSAKQAADPEAKKLFMQLANAERTHFNVVMQRYKSRYDYPR